MTEPSQAKKIIVDEDWKEEAQREKEVLAKTVEEEKKQRQRPRVPEEATLALLAGSLATQAMISMGDVENPVTRARTVHLDEAKFHIDLLEMLQTKTKGNLTEEEERLLEGLLFDLRMRFVEKSRC